MKDKLRSSVAGTRADAERAWALPGRPPRPQTDGQDRGFEPRSRVVVCFLIPLCYDPIASQQRGTRIS